MALLAAKRQGRPPLRTAASGPWPSIRDDQAPNLPPSAAQACAVSDGTNPWPLHAFMPLQALDAVLHALWPLHALAPKHFPAAEAGLVAAMAPARNMAAAVRAIPVVFDMTCPFLVQQRSSGAFSEPAQDIGEDGVQRIIVP